MEDYSVIELGLQDTFCFACDPNVPCFNACGYDVVQYLTPYDILRLKNSLGLSSAAFLERYTTHYTGQGTGLEVVTLKRSAADRQRQCPFANEQGCGVYQDRPSSCRVYPLARVASRCRETGRVTERYMLLKEPHCKGFDRGVPRTVSQWIEDQGLAPYNDANDRLMEIISAKNRTSPGRPLDVVSKKIFYTGCYDLDRFRQEVFEKGDLEGLDVDDATLAAAASEDTVLLVVSLAWVKKMLFSS